MTLGDSKKRNGAGDYSENPAGPAQYKDGQHGKPEPGSGFPYTFAPGSGFS